MTTPRGKTPPGTLQASELQHAPTPEAETDLTALAEDVDLLKAALKLAENGLPDELVAEL